MSALAVNADAARTVTLSPSDNLQAALDAAAFGDRIVLPAGATFNGPFIFRYKGPGTGTDADYITVESSAIDQLPTGQRVLPTDAPHLTRLVSRGANQAVIIVDPKAHHWRLQGLEITTARISDFVSTLVFVGWNPDTDSRFPATLDQMAHHIILDRLYIHPVDYHQEVKQGISLISGQTDILNSTILGLAAKGFDAQAILAGGGAGPYRIENNFLEATGENFMSGGYDPVVPGLVPSDITIRFNHFFKRLAWKGGDPSNTDGDVWNVKNHLELKNAQRVMIEGNIFENVWPKGQTGFSILLTPRNQDGTCPQCTVKDVTFRNNIVRHATGVIAMLKSDPTTHPVTTPDRVLIQNNLFDDISGEFLHGQIDHLVVDHNTVLHRGNTCSFTEPFSGFVLTNNIMAGNDYNCHVDPPHTLATVAPASVWHHNAMVKSPVRPWVHEGDIALGQWSEAGFEHFNNGNGGNYRLTAGSVLKGRGADGNDIGADIDAIFAATSGVIRGTAPLDPSAPPPTVSSDAIPVRLYPNPWRADRHASREMTFDQLGTSARVRIFTMAGHLIRDLDASTGTTTWDLKTENGRRVASGMYFYLISNTQGHMARGKLAVIR